jgi:hypothetical protein
MLSEQDLEKQEAAELALSQWEQVFRAAAKADDYRIFRAHMRRLDLPNEPELLLEGTILVVQMSLAYLALDNQEVLVFLTQQRYDSSDVVWAPYQLTFDIHGKAYGRINVPAAMRQVDLADLYATPWYAYERVGYRGDEDLPWVTHDLPALKRFVETLQDGHDYGLVATEW